MLFQLKCFSTLSRDFAAILSMFSCDPSKLLIAFAKSLENVSGSLGSPLGDPIGSKGTNNPVSSWMTTSGIPPTAEATTGVPHAIASSGGYPNPS